MIKLDETVESELAEKLQKLSEVISQLIQDYFDDKLKPDFDGKTSGPNTLVNHEEF